MAEQDKGLGLGLDASDYRLVSQEALREILASSRVIDLEAGDVLLRQGETSEAAYFLQDGAMQVYAETAYGPAILATVQSPRLIGEIGAFAGVRRTASIKATTRARLFEIERAQLLELGRRSPEILFSTVQQLGQEIASVNEALALYSNALAALETREFDNRILADLVDPPPTLAAFAAAFHRFANEIVGKRRRQDEMASAALIQQSFLPKVGSINRTRQDIEIAAKIRPAREVGGDFYDFFMLDDDRLALVIGDVCGKGTPASLFASIVITVLRTIGRDHQDVSTVVSRANALLCEENDASMFATVFFGVLNLQSGEMKYCNCGHVAPVHLSATGQLHRLRSTGLPLAIDADRTAAVAVRQVEPGDKLVLITDGVTEAINAGKEEFGESRLLSTITCTRESSPGELLTRLFADVDAFAEGEEQADDIGCLTIERKRSCL